MSNFDTYQIHWVSDAQLDRTFSVKRMSHYAPDTVLHEYTVNLGENIPGEPLDIQTITCDCLGFRRQIAPRQLHKHVLMAQQLEDAMRSGGNDQIFGVASYDKRRKEITSFVVHPIIDVGTDAEEYLEIPDYLRRVE